MSSAASGAKEQVARLLTLVPWLHQRGEVRVDEAAAALGVTPAQLRRDLGVLFLCGLPGGYPDDLIDVDYDALDEQGVVRVSNADYLARPLRLTPTEASALIVALRTLRDGADESTADVVDRTIRKLEGAAEDGARAAQQVDVTVDRRERELGGLRTLLAKAVEAGKQVQLTYYVPARDENTERAVDPLRIVAAQGGTYLDAWCHLADGYRLFRLDRIVGAEPLDTPVSEHASEGPRDLSAGIFQPSEDDVRVRLLLETGARWVAEYYPVAATREVGDGRLEVEMYVGDPRWLQRLILRLAPYATVLEPEEFTESSRAAARDALRLYR